MGTRIPSRWHVRPRVQQQPGGQAWQRVNLSVGPSVSASTSSIFSCLQQLRACVRVRVFCGRDGQTQRVFGRWACLAWPTHGNEWLISGPQRTAANAGAEGGAFTLSLARFRRRSCMDPNADWLTRAATSERGGRLPLSLGLCSLPSDVVLSHLVTVSLFRLADEFFFLCRFFSLFKLLS